MGEDYIISLFSWGALHKDIMINIRGTAFVTNWYIMREREIISVICAKVCREEWFHQEYGHV